MFTRTWTAHEDNLHHQQTKLVQGSSVFFFPSCATKRIDLFPGCQPLEPRASFWPFGLWAVSMNGGYRDTPSSLDTEEFSENPQKCMMTGGSPMDWNHPGEVSHHQKKRFPSAKQTEAPSPQPLWLDLYSGCGDQRHWEQHGISMGFNMLQLPSMGI